MASAHQLMSQQGPHFSTHSKVKIHRFLRFIHNNNYHNHHTLLQTGFSDEVNTTSLIPLDTILPEICALSLVSAVLCGLK